MLGSYLKHLSSVWVAIAFHAHTFVNYEGLINLSGQLLSHHNVPYSGSIGAWYYDNHHEWSRLSIENGGNQLIRECGDPTWLDAAEVRSVETVFLLACPQMCHKSKVDSF